MPAASPVHASLAPGTMLAHYEVRSVLGSGAMGTVYLAHDTALDRPVALKVLRPEIAGDEVFSQRFFREARAAARVNHPNLTHVYFVGSRDERPFFAMEYVPGETIEERVQARGPAGLAEGIDILVQAARGLAAAHRVGVIHRDVKPSNLIVLPDGTVKVTDFGLSKSLGGEAELSGGGGLVGTPTYMSPEQCRGDPVDARTDVYELGLTAWYLFAGKPAFGGTEIGRVLADQMTTPLPPATGARPDLPEALDRVLSRLCAKAPKDRPAGMEEVVALLEGLRPRRIDLAPFMARGSAFLFDAVVAIVAGVALTVAMEFAQGLLHVPSLPKYAHSLLWGSVFAGFQLGGELWYGTTLGKSLFHLRVARADGAPPGRVALLVRFLLRYPLVAFLFVPGIPTDLVFFVGWSLQVLAVVTAAVTHLVFKGLTASDLVTKTRVVYRVPPPEKA